MTDKETILKCTDQALRYLAIREHNEFELKTKLLRKNYDAEIVNKVLENLKKDSSLSEERYVTSFIRSNNRRHPEGKSLILQRLASKGTDRSVAQKITHNIYTEEYTDDLICRLIENLIRKGKAENLKQAITKHGFSANEITRAMSQHTGNENSADICRTNFT